MTLLSPLSLDISCLLASNGCLTVWKYVSAAMESPSPTSLVPRITRACVEGYALDLSVCPYIAISPREALPEVQVGP